MIIYDPIITGSFQINGSTISSVESIDAVSQSVADLKSDSGSFSSRVSLVETSTNSLNQASSSYALKADISGSLGPNATLIRSLTAAGITGSVTSLSSSIAGNLNTKLNIADTGSFAKTNVNNNFGGLQTFNNVSITGTGSFAFIQSITGSAKIIGDSFIVVNNNTPAERYGGLSVYDSGSAGTTGSLFFDGQLNDWNYEYTTPGGTDYGTVLFGPEYSIKGSPTYPANNKLQKGNGTHHLADSNVTDTGTLIVLGSNTQVTGSLLTTGNVGIGTTSPVNTYSGLTISGTDPSLAIKTTSASGWVWTQYVNSSGTNNFSMGVNQTQPYWGVKAGAGLDSPNLAINSSGNVGIGSTNPNQKLVVQGDWNSSDTNNTQLYLQGSTNTNKQLRIGYDTTNDFGYIQSVISGTSTTKLVLNPSGGQLIINDTTSPSTQFALDVNGYINIRNGSGLVSRTSSTELWGLGDSDFNVLRAGVFGIATFTARDMIFATNNTERIRIDSSGRVGIGTTPITSWTTAAKVLNIGGYGVVYNDGLNNFLFANNTYFNGSNNIYANNGYATRYYQDSNGSHLFQTAGSGTAGNTATYDTKFTIANSGAATLTNSLLVNSGNNSTIGLVVYGATSGNNAVVQIDRGSGSHKGSGLYIGGANYTDANDQAFIELSAGAYSGASTRYIVCRDNSGYDFVVRGDGRVGVGVASPGEKFEVADGGIRITETGVSSFTTSYSSGKVQFLTDSSGTQGFYFRTYSGGYADRFIIKASGEVNVAGSILPSSDASYNLGSTSLRWNNLYTTDLHLSNKGKQNDVDGTWGDWTIQEGEEDLFIINHRTGNKYKFILQKVD